MLYTLIPTAIAFGIWCHVHNRMGRGWDMRSYLVFTAILLSGLAIGVYIECTQGAFAHLSLARKLPGNMYPYEHTMPAR